MKHAKFTYTQQEAINVLQDLHSDSADNVEVIIKNETPVNNNSAYSVNNIAVLLYVANNYNDRDPQTLIPCIKAVQEASRGMNGIPVMGLTEAKQFVDALRNIQR